MGESFDAEFEAKVASCTNAEQIKQLMLEKNLALGFVKRDWDPSLILPVENAAAPRGYAKTLTVNGQKTIIEGATEQELLANETAFYRAAMQPAATETRTEQPRNERGQF